MRFGPNSLCNLFYGLTLIARVSFFATPSRSAHRQFREGGIAEVCEAGYAAPRGSPWSANGTGFPIPAGPTGIPGTG